MSDLSVIRFPGRSVSLCTVGTAGLGPLLLELVAHAVAKLVHFTRNRAASLFAACGCKQQAQSHSNTHAKQQCSRGSQRRVIFTPDGIGSAAYAPRCFTVSVTCA